MTVKLIPVGQPTVNKRVYPPDVVQEMINRAKPRIEARTLLVYRVNEPYEDVGLENAVGYVSRLFVDDGWLWADVELLPGKEATGNFTINASGHLTAEEQPKVSDATLSHLISISPDWSVSSSGTV